MEKCISSFDWKAAEKACSTLNEEDASCLLRTTPIAKMAAICYSQEEGAQAICPDRRWLPSIFLAFFHLQGLEFYDVDILSAKAWQLPELCPFYSILMERGLFCRFEQDFAVEDTQRLLIDKLRQRCPAHETLIGQAFALGASA